MSKGLLGMAALLLLTATACQPAPPPPLKPPAEIVSAEVLTNPVVAGELLTIRIVASHALGISRIGLSDFKGPANAQLPYVGMTSPVPCVYTTIPVTPTPGEATYTVSCVMPETAPNGAWEVAVEVTPPGYESASTTVGYEVIGGTDDNEAHKLTVVTHPPASIIPGSSFPLVLRVEDTNLGEGTRIPPASFYLAYVGGAHTFNCTDLVRTAVSPTVEETSMMCHTSGGQGWGRYVEPIDLVDNYGRKSHYMLEAWVALV
jgi:hypothetical protein